MATVLIAACPSDVPTKYGYYYLRRAADVLAQYGHKIVFLRSANLQNFHDALIKYDPKLVMINGHGGRKAVTGCMNEVILAVVGYDPELGKSIIRQNPDWVKGRIVFLLTCNSGLDLAPKLVENDAATVIGFKRDYIFVSDNDDPEHDLRSQPFFLAPIQFPLILAKGGTVLDAIASVQDAYTYYIEQAERKGDVEQAKYLNFDLENMVSYYHNGYDTL